METIDGFRCDRFHSTVRHSRKHKHEQANLDGPQEPVTEGFKNGATLLQFEGAGVLAEVFCHRVAH